MVSAASSTYTWPGMRAVAGADAQGPRIRIGGSVAIEENWTGVESLPEDLPLPSMPAPGRMTRDAVARLSADGLGMVAGLMSGIITARALGPSGRGVYSTLAFLIFIGGGLATCGLGEAVVVLVGRQRRPAQSVLSTALFSTLVLSVLAVVIFVAAASLLIHRPGLVRTLAIGSVGIPFVAAANVLGGLLNARERIKATSLGLGLMAGSTAIFTWLFVAALHRGVFGGILASTCGTATGTILFLALVKRDRFSIRPHLERAVITPALSFGVTVQGALFLQSLSARFDLLLVYRLMGARAAGFYSIALTLSLLVAAVPNAVSYSTFPRLSRFGPDEARPLLLHTTRLAVTASALTAALIGAACPLAIPILFGKAFMPAVMPTVILVTGGLLYGIQWSLARGRGAQGMPGLLFSSFTLSTAVMVAGDLTLIPRYGLNGAAVAAVVGSFAGAVTCVVSFRRKEGVGVLELLPRWSDIAALVSVVSGLVPRWVKLRGTVEAAD